MSALLIDPMDDATSWAAVEPDGVTPSSELTLASDTQVFAYGPDATSARISATADATGHALQRSIAPVNLSSFSQLRLSIRSSRLAHGLDAPFFLELRLGSTALPLADPANIWQRYLPVTRPDAWETVRIGIDDLDPAIAGALTALQLRCVDAGPFVVHLDDMTAVQPEMLADTERSLEARLAGITVNGAAAPALVRGAAEPPPGPPALDLFHLDIRFAPERVRTVELLRDFTSDGGARVVPAGEPYDLYYAIAPVAASRDDEAQLVTAVLQRLAPVDELIVNGERQPLEALTTAPAEWAPGDGTLLLRYRIRARQDTGAPPRSVRRVEEIAVETRHGVTA